MKKRVFKTINSTQMKKIISILSIALILVSCDKNTQEKQLNFSGKVVNTEENILTIYNILSTETDTLVLSENGHYNESLKLEEGFYYFSDGKNYLRMYLEGELDQQISYDAKDFENSLVISGKGGAITSYIRESSQLEKELKGDSKKFHGLNEEEFKAKSKEIKLAKKALLATKIDLPEKFRVKENRNLHFDYLITLYFYKDNHAYYYEKPDFTVAENFLDELDKMDYNNPSDYFFSGSYRGLVYNKNYRLAQEYESKDSIAFAMAYLKALDEVKEKSIKGFMAYQYVKYEISVNEDIPSLYDRFLEISTNQNHRDEISRIYQKALKTAKGQPSPQFTNYENFAGGTTSLKDLKGKYVYIDFWATWCGPCKREIPFLKEVEDQFHGKNIVFVSISLDKKQKYTAWKNMVEEKNLGGVQLFADNAFNSSFVKDYSVLTIPRFVLLDPSGNVVSNNAPRPSDEKLTELLTSLDL